MTKIAEKNSSSGASGEEKKALQFISMYVHDLESPLVSLKAILRLLERGSFDLNKPTHRKLLSSGQIALDRAESLIYDLLSAARAGESDLGVDLADCQLKELITDCCLMAEPSAAEYNVQLIMDLPKSEIIVRGDKLLLERVLDNLIYNAVRHTPPKGRVTIACKPIGELSEISVTDTGPGFKDIIPDELFSIFAQTDYRVRGLHRGVGIGLYLCRLAVEKMSGQIKAENGPDGGALFRFSLPMRGK